MTDAAPVLILMVRDPGANPPPYVADVHPDNELAYTLDGWRRGVASDVAERTAHLDREACIKELVAGFTAFLNQQTDADLQQQLAVMREKILREAMDAHADAAAGDLFAEPPPVVITDPAEQADAGRALLEAVKAQVEGLNAEISAEAPETPAVLEAKAPETKVELQEAILAANGTYPAAANKAELADILAKLSA